MKHHATSKFWKSYRSLPEQVQSLADEKFSLLKDNPKHPSLHVKKVDRFWSVRIGLHYRALAVEEDGGLVWFWIGTHDEYDRIIER